jgi:glycosyltransferase involved in cell wall biosynthesis
MKTEHLVRQPLTVLHIFSGDLWAGAEVMIFTLLNQLKNDPGFKIIALSFNEGILSRKLREAGVEIYVVPEALNSFPLIFKKSLDLLKNKRKQIALIHSHRSKENVLAFLLAKTMGVECLVTTLHGLPEPLPYLGMSKEKRRRLKLKINHFFLRHSFTRAVAVSEEMKRTLVGQYSFSSSKVEVIYNGISFPTMSVGRRPFNRGCFHIGTVGRMVPVKNFNLFLETAAEVRRQTDDARFSILGDGQLKGSLIKKAKDLKIDDRVDFLPPRLDPSPYYRSLDLYLNTSVHEGIPLSILEAMSCAKPVVAPRIGGIPEMITHGEHGLLVDERHPGEFARACLRLMRDKDLGQMLGENALKRVTTSFSDYRMAESYKKVYQELCLRS